MEISYLCAARLGDVLELNGRILWIKGSTLSKTRPALNNQGMVSAITYGDPVSPKCIFGTCEYVINTTKGGKVIAKTLTTGGIRLNVQPSKKPAFRLVQLP